MTPPAVMSADLRAAWLAGARAAREEDVAEVRRLAGGHSAAVRWYCAETTAASPEWSERADYESRASATLQGAGDALAALPLPPPPQTAPAPTQSPLPLPDGWTGPQGDGAPAGGCGVAEAAARRREQAMAFAASAPADPPREVAAVTTAPTAETERARVVAICEEWAARHDRRCDAAFAEGRESASWAHSRAREACLKIARSVTMAPTAGTHTPSWMRWAPHDPSDVDPVMLSPWDRWMEAHPDEFAAHAGRYVAVHPREGVVASEETMEALVAEVRSLGLPQDEVLLTRVGDGAVRP